MSYSNSQFSIVEPAGLIRFSNSSTTTFGNNNKVLMTNTENIVGTNIATISSGIITLPVGYYYLLEASLSAGDAYNVSTHGTRQIYTQFYDENSSAYIGTQSYQNGEKPNADDDSVLFSRDDTARCWIDASSSEGSVSWKMQTITNSTYDRSDVQYTQSPQQLWVGYTRCLVWRLN